MTLISGFITINETALLEINSDPRLSGGLDRPVGDIAVDTESGLIYIKKTTSPTGWDVLFQGTIEQNQIPVANASQQFSGSNNLTWNGSNLGLNGTVNNVNVQSHSSRHLPNGDDPLTTLTGVTISSSGANTLGSSNAFSRADHTHKVELAQFNVRSVAQTQTTSSTDVLLDSMTITPPSGEYLGFFYTNSNNTTNGAINRFSVYVGGVQQSETLQNIRVSNNRNHSWFVSLPVLVDGSEAVEIRWNRSTGTGRTFGRSISLLRVS
jgi:hypothetical protein